MVAGFLFSSGVGGDKRTQDADISRAAGYLQDFKRRQK